MHLPEPPTLPQRKRFRLRGVNLWGINGGALIGIAQAAIAFLLLQNLGMVPTSILIGIPAAILLLGWLIHLYQRMLNDAYSSLDLDRDLLEAMNEIIHSQARLLKKIIREANDAGTRKHD